MEGELQLMNAKQAGDYLGLTESRIRQLARAGELKGERIGRDWIFTVADVKAFTPKPKGRPPKAAPC